MPFMYEEDQPLGKWVSHQRKRFKNGRMDQEQIRRLGVQSQEQRERRKVEFAVQEAAGLL
jgi:hypothetical protein